MKYCIVGSRDFTNDTMVQDTMKWVVKFYGKPTSFVCADARGADKLGREYSRKIGIEPVIKEADWTKFGPAAGPIRNSEVVAEMPDVLIAFWECDFTKPRSGSKDVVTKALATKKIIVICVNMFNGEFTIYPAENIQPTITENNSYTNTSSKQMDDYEFNLKRHWKNESSDDGDDYGGTIKHFKDE